ncbi:hypothetical protein psyc5s11_49740 [Clostridium gelidum]|uniref:Amidohydrolase-related domain-containing protein n=1 Tax=Clostridium gelidum TaxID=704125 RepID=A0ABM7TAY3_9CLOT|nr:hypothetical protein psyc5s11_49740 [Clostridium gelidum]
MVTIYELIITYIVIITLFNFQRTFSKFTASNLHILYGSDFPHTPVTTCKFLSKALENTEKLTAEEKIL